MRSNITAQMHQLFEKKRSPALRKESRYGSIGVLKHRCQEKKYSVEIEQAQKLITIVVTEILDGISDARGIIILFTRRFDAFRAEVTSRQTDQLRRLPRGKQPQMRRPILYHGEIPPGVNVAERAERHEHVVPGTLPG